jgi:hypothetical protein
MIRWLVALSLAGMAQASYAVYDDGPERYNIEEKSWAEQKTAIPAYPKTENLIEFIVGPTEHNRFYLDGSTITVGGDGIVRYVLVVKTPGGATNVSLEAMRCDTRQLKLVAVAGSDGHWDRLENPQWHLIENKLVNQHHAILNREFLCPASHAPRDVADVLAALRRGKYPDVP